MDLRRTLALSFHISVNPPQMFVGLSVVKVNPFACNTLSGYVSSKPTDKRFAGPTLSFFLVFVAATTFHKANNFPVNFYFLLSLWPNQLSGISGFWRILLKIYRFGKWLVFGASLAFLVYSVESKLEVVVLNLAVQLR